MTDERDLIRNLHIAMRRYVMERMNSFDQLKPGPGGVFTLEPPVDGKDTFMEVFSMEVMPKLVFLNSIRWELAAIDPEAVTTQDEMRDLLDIAAQISFDHASGSDSNPIVIASIDQEHQAFSIYLHSLSVESLQSVDPLPFHRALSYTEQIDVLSAFGQRWGVEVAGGRFSSNYYPIIPRPSTPQLNLASMEAFDAKPLVEANGTEIVQRTLKTHGIQHVYILEQNYPGTEREVSQLDLARAIPHIIGFAFSKSLDWMIYTSWRGTVTIGGEWLLDAVKREWPDWENHVDEYFDMDDLT
jgi:hypothetical protein